MKRSIAFVYLIMLAITAFSQSTKTYEYDAAGRLTRTTYSNGVQIFYTYDALGNRTSKTVINGYPEGAIPGIFSVGTNTYAYFSQGNLQYRAVGGANGDANETASAGENVGGTWRFAEHQWDYVGYNDGGNVYENGVKCDNSLASETYDGWIDIFDWGTSGYNHGANCYQPWSRSSSNQDYLAYGVEGLSLYEGDAEHRGQADWGYNPILNGGNTENSGWRTPTAAEWDYLLNTRTTSSGIRFAFALVNDVEGMILLPDDWDASVYTLNNPNTSIISLLEFVNFADFFEAYLNSNTIDAQTWTDVLEPSGAVFIPYYYMYWTSSSGYLSSASSDNRNFNVLLSDVSTWGWQNSSGYLGQRCQVRLINNVVNHCMVSVSCGRAGLGSVNGGGSCEYGGLCTVVAEPAEGYAFAHWTENGVVVSTDASYTFEVYTNHNLVAQFRDLQNDAPDLLEGRFSIGDERVARFAKGNLNLAFDFNATGQANVEWSFAEHQWHRKYFNANAFAANVENYLQNNGLDFLYQRFLHDANYDKFVVDLGCWTTLSDEEWEYLLHQRITASGMHYAFCQVDNVYGIVLFPDDWEASTYPLPSNVIDEEMTLLRSMVFKYISINDWNNYFEPAHAVFLPLVFNGLFAGNLFDDDMGATFGTIAFNYSHFICGDGYQDENGQWHDDGVCVFTPSENIVFEAASTDGYSKRNLCFGYERPVQIETRNYEVIGAQPNPLWAGEVNGGGLFESQMRLGETCTLTATAKSGHTFEGWYENDMLVSEDPVLSFDIEASRFLEARYSSDVYYTINVDLNPSDGGSVAGTGSYEEWQECELVASPSTHYHFVGWMEDGILVSDSSNYVFTVMSDRNLQACFAENQSYWLEISAIPEEGGKVFPYMDALSAGHESYYAGEYEETAQASIIAGANDGYRFVGWKSDGEWVSINNIYNFQFPSSNLALEAHFEPCEVNPEPDPELLNGRFSISGCSTVGFAKGNVIFHFDQSSTQASVTWEFAPTQYYRQNHGDDGRWEQSTLTSRCKEGIDLVPNIFEYIGLIDFSCWHLLSSEEWNYLLEGRDIEVRYAYAKVNNVEGLLVMPDDWDPTIYSFSLPNEIAPYSTNIISRYDWNTVLEPAGVLFLPANGMIMSDYNNTIAYQSKMNGENLSGCYTNLMFSDAADGSGEISFMAPMLMPMVFSSMRLAQILETASPTVTLSVDASQADRGTVNGGGSFTCGTQCTVSATANEDYVFRYWLENGKVVSTEADYSFIVSSDRVLTAEFAEESEVCSVDLCLLYKNNDQFELALLEALFGWFGDSIVISFGGVQPELRFTLPIIQQANWYEEFLADREHYGDFDNIVVSDSVVYRLLVDRGCNVTVSLERNDLFLEETEEMNHGFVLAYTEADTIVYGNANEVLPFSFVGDCEYIPHKQTFNLSAGWSWLSTYVDQNGIDGLGMMEEDLGANGVIIKSQSDGFVSFSNDTWVGSLNGITNEKMYLVNINNPSVVTIMGPSARLDEHPITLSPNWNWIGYPSPFEKDINEALADLNATDGDVLKSQSSFAIYSSLFGWYGSLNTMSPGMGYMYQSLNSEAVTLTYSEGGSRSVKKNAEFDDNHWVPSIDAYPYNMSIMAVVELNGEEVNDDQFELAAFIGDECRGSSQLVYFEPLHRYVAFLSVAGLDDAELRFALFDAHNEKEYIATNVLRFKPDVVLGGLDSPYVIRFGDTGMNENEEEMAYYPNPVQVGQLFRIALPDSCYGGSVSIVSALGVEVSKAILNAQPTTLRAPSAAGIYLLQMISNDGKVYCRKLIVTD